VDSAAGAIARFEEGDAVAFACKLSRRRQAGETGPNDQNVVLHCSTGTCKVDGTIIQGEHVFSGAVFEGDVTVVFCAMSATKNGTVVLNTVPKNFAAAVRADRGEPLNGALERVKRVRLACHGHRECLVIVVSTNFALHGNLLAVSSFVAIS
jgi:hypothetical protein